MRGMLNCDDENFVGALVDGLIDQIRVFPGDDLADALSGCGAPACGKRKS